MAQGREWIGSISRVEVTPSRDGILPAVGRGTVTRRDGVLGVVVVSLQGEYFKRSDEISYLINLMIEKISLTFGASLSKIKARGV